MTDEIHEFFSDIFSIHLNPWASALTFGLRAVQKGEQDKYNIRIRMSLEQLKALAVVLRRVVRDYEQRTQTKIDLPKELLNQLGIGPEDWGL